MNGCIPYQEDDMPPLHQTLCIQAMRLQASSFPNLLRAAEPLQRTLIRSVPAGNVYSYENAACEAVEEMENRQGKLISRRFYRPATPACAYLHSVGLGTGRYWRDDDERTFHCLSPMTQLETAAEPYDLELSITEALMHHG